jgi:phospholipid/cholesterol/gamma-HCH transport system substrate-binding protein
MSTTNNKRAVTVGIFIFLALLIFIGGVLTLGGQKKTFEKKITVKAIFDDVGGLQAGNNVWFSGVKIGTVRRMQFHGGSKVEVEMNIEEKAQPYIRKNAKAKISSEGFIGNKIVVIYGGSMQAGQVEGGDALGVEKGLSTDEIMATFQENNKNLVDITGNLKIISQRLTAGEGTIGKLLTDETLMNNLQVAAFGLRQASANAQQLTNDLSQYTASLQRKGSLANDLVTDTVIFSRLRSTAVQMQEASRKANQVTNDLRMVSAKLNDSNTPVGTLLMDMEAAKNLKGTLRNLEAGSQKLDENMEALQHNFLLRGFFRKKAKREEKEAKPVAVKEAVQ